jgi:putative transcriptional regulator
VRNGLAHAADHLARTAQSAESGVMTRTSLKGQLLISAGGLYDPNFRHTVVLIGEHGGEGAVGVILTRPLDVTVEEAVPVLADLVEPGERLFQGGPVEPSQAVLLAELADPGLIDVPVFGSVGFLTDEVPSDVRPEVRRARVFVGHAGWGPGQLEAELEADSWILEQATEEDVFTSSPEALWRRVLERPAPGRPPTPRPEHARPVPTSGEDAAAQHGPGDAVDPLDEGGGSHVQAVLLGAGHHALEGVGQHVAEALVDLVQRPHVVLRALDPLEVGDGDAAGVGQDVGEDEDALVLEDLVGLEVGGAVGALGQDAAADAGRVLRVIWFWSAHGARTSHSISRSSSLVTASASG